MILFCFRIDFYESCVDQLKKDLPKYLKHQSGTYGTMRCPYDPSW